VADQPVASRGERHDPDPLHRQLDKMKIIQITPGSGGTFYCQNCLRDGSQVRALRAMGHDVVMVPMYLPLFLDEEAPESEAPVFFGAVSVYLREQVPLLRNMPTWLQHLLDSPAILKWAAGKAGSTRAAGLEEMTLSLLRGEEGRQAEELSSLVSWLTNEGEPDVVHLSNALLLGLAKPLREQLGVPVVCSLQDEDVWVDAMPSPGKEAVWQEMSDQATHVDRFVAVSNYYAERMRSKLSLPPERLSVVPIGIDLSGYEPATSPPPRTVGFLSRLSEGLGLQTLVEAFILLKGDSHMQDVRLRAMGGQTDDDAQFVDQMRRRLAARGLSEDVEFLTGFGLTERQEFLKSLSLLSVPVPTGEAFGTYQIEALACGIPVVQPNVGAFPEIVNRTGGGIIYEPNDAPALSQALISLLTAPDHARELGRRGRQVVLDRFSVEQMARNLMQIYGELPASTP